ncbi:hypothetical protein [Chitinophaga sp. LS1]|nr:hypothetical protein [Chitinophaga sp. LS1]WPV65330.1 hypothetical protein QQL36_26365 [Chitinophaga sp. LS1]
MKSRLFVLSVLLTSQLAIGQHSNRKILHLVDDSTLTRLVIPDSALTCHADALYYSFELGDGKHHTGYDIYWFAPEIDGSYRLSITQKQLYLYSGHDNPNPNYLYWLVCITPNQYKLINKKIKNSKVLFGKPYGGFYPYYCVAYKEAVPENLYATLQRLITLFNSGLPAMEQIQLISKDEFEKINPVQLIMNDEEINEVPADEEVSTPS